MKRSIIAAIVAAGVLVTPAAALAAKPAENPGNGHETAVHNTHANEHACWGQDRSFHASQSYFGGNMDIKQFFDPALGGVGEQHAAWVAAYCS